MSKEKATQEPGGQAGGSPSQGAQAGLLASEAQSKGHPRVRVGMEGNEDSIPQTRASRGSSGQEYDTVSHSGWSRVPPPPPQNSREQNCRM